MIRHDEAFALLHDLADGRLEPAARAAVAEHALACDACARELAAVRALRDAAAALPCDLPPDRDLWPGIADRLGDPDTNAAPAHAPTHASPRRLWPVWAAAAVIACAALAPRLRDGGDPAAPPQVASLDATYAEVRRDGETLLAAGELPEASARDLRDGMSAIDRAVHETRDALRSVADAPDQFRDLTNGYRKKIDLLQRLVGRAART